jgi:hypothetical protein
MALEARQQVKTDRETYDSSDEELSTAIVPTAPTIAPFQKHIMRPQRHRNMKSSALYRADQVDKTEVKPSLPQVRNSGDIIELTQQPGSLEFMNFLFIYIELNRMLKFFLLRRIYNPTTKISSQVRRRRDKPVLR